MSPAHQIVGFSQVFLPRRDNIRDPLKPMATKSIFSMNLETYGCGGAKAEPLLSC